MYRERTRACPACATPMEEVPVADQGDPVQVDRCARCAGLFLEFFDGEPTALSRALVRAGAADAKSASPTRELTCPDCSEPMTRKRYLGTGPVIARCETCLAVFVDPDELRQLARLELAPETRVEEPGWLDKLVHWMRGQG